MNVDNFEQVDKVVKASTRKVVNLESDFEEQRRKYMTPRKYVDVLGLTKKVKEHEIETGKQR